MHIHPLSEGQCLVIPRQHSERVHELAPRRRAHLFEVGVQGRCAIKASALVCDDANFIVNDGCHANQEVPHVHLHVIPRRKRDHLRILKRMLRKAFASRAHQAGYDQLDRQASLIRRALPQIIQAPN